MQELVVWQFGVGGLDAAPATRGSLSDFAPGSRNLMPDGLTQSRVFRGLTPIGGGGTGARRMFQIKSTWGGLDDDGGTAGAGSLFSTIADMLVYVGQGQVMLEGVPIAGAIASNLLRFLLKWNGSYTDPQSGPYVAGLPEATAPEVGIIESSIFGAPNLSGSVSVKYARFRKTTGGRSRASATSRVLILTEKAIYSVVPLPVAGQTHHIFFGTDTKLGGIGLHYRIARANPFTNDEYTEADVERNVTITSVSTTTVADDTLNAAAGTFSAGDIGKLVEDVSGIVFAANTVIEEVLGPTAVRLSAPVTSGAAGVANFVAYAGGVRRSVVLNWTPSDLIEETAWVLDFPPPSASHAFQLENRMFVCSYADAATRATESAAAPDSSASSANPGTALVPSLANQFESYDPRYPVFLPEPVVDILSDGMESYKFIGGRNGVYAAQYLNVQNAAPLTLSVLLRGEGVAHAGNWCARERAIYLYTGRGQLVRIIEGGVVDKKFADKVRPIFRNIAQEDVNVSAHPAGGGVVYSFGQSSYFFDEATGRWSTECDLESSLGGEVISSVATQSELIMTLENAGVRSAHYFDKPGGGVNYFAAVGHYENKPAQGRPKIVQRIRGTVQSASDGTVYVGLHVNLHPITFAGSIVSSSNALHASEPVFSTSMLGHYVIVRQAADSGFGPADLYARIKQVVSETQVRLGTPVFDLTASDDLPAERDVTNGYCLVGLRILPLTKQPNRSGPLDFRSVEMLLAGNSSLAVSMYATNPNETDQPLNIAIDGEIIEEEGWSLPARI